VGSVTIRVRYASNHGEQLYDCPHAGSHIRDGADVYDIPFCESVVTRILQGPHHPDSVDICTLFVHSHMGNHMTMNVQDITLLHASPALGREFLDPQTGVRTDPPRMLFYTVAALLFQHGCVVPHMLCVACAWSRVFVGVENYLCLCVYVLVGVYAYVSTCPSLCFSLSLFPFTLSFSRRALALCPLCSLSLSLSPSPSLSLSLALPLARYSSFSLSLSVRRNKFMFDLPPQMGVHLFCLVCCGTITSNPTIAENALDPCGHSNSKGSANADQLSGVVCNTYLTGGRDPIMQRALILQQDQARIHLQQVTIQNLAHLRIAGTAIGT